MKKIIKLLKARVKAIPPDRWFLVIFFACLMILAFLFGKGCNQPVTVINPVHDENYVIEKADLQATIRRQDNVIDELNKDLIEMNFSLNESRQGMTKAMNKASTAIEMYKQAKLTTDTSNMIVYCDSVIKDHESFTISVVEYTRTSDSVINTQAMLIGNQEKLIEAQRNRINLTDKQLNKTMHDFHSLAYDNEVLKKKLTKKKGGFLKGVVVGVAGVMAGLILIK